MFTWPNLQTSLAAAADYLKAIITAGVEFAQALGANLVVLAREISLKEIAAIRFA